MATYLVDGSTPIHVEAGLCGLSGLRDRGGENT